MLERWRYWHGRRLARRAALLQLRQLMTLALPDAPAALGRVATRAQAANQRLQRDMQQLASDRRPKLPALHWPGAESLLGALQADGRPVVMASLHLGCYPRYLLALAPLLGWMGRIAVLRRRPADAVEQALLDRFAASGLRVRVLRTDAHPARSAIRALRAGSHLLILYDVPASFGVGRTAPVQLLGQPARLPCGPADLARAGGALLWPFALLPDATGVRMASLDPLACVGETRTAWRQRALTVLADHATACIRRAPGHWLLWGHLPSIWQPTTTAAADGANTAH